MRGSKSNLNEGSSSCKIRLLDDVELSFDFKKETRGQSLIDFVCGQLDLLEKDYFGLRYVDSNKQRHWLDSAKEISKQLKECRPPFMFFFRVKFYPTDPTKLREEITKYQLYLQLKRDILHGRLLCPFNNITDLAAHIVQAEIGDYSEEEHSNTYLNGIKLLPRQNEKLEEKIMEYHKTLQGYNPAEAERRFLNLARSQDLYGVDPHPCKDQEDFPLYLGLTPQGIQIIREARRVSGFIWSEVNKVHSENKLFYIQVVSEKKKKNYAFRLADTPACKHLWKCAKDHKAFYSEEPVKTQVPRRSVLSPQNILRRNKYKFSGKTEMDIRNEGETIRRPSPANFERKSSLRLSVQQNRKSCVSMPDLEQIQAKFRKNDEEEKKRRGGDDSEGSSNGSFAKSDVDKDDDLAEFETVEFPVDEDSARSSLNLDNISTASSQEVSSSEPPPVIHVENVDSVTTSMDRDELSTQQQPQRHNRQQQQAKKAPEIKIPPPPSDTDGDTAKMHPSSTTSDFLIRFNELYSSSPMLFLLMLVVAVVPVAIVVQMMLFRS